MEKCKTCKHFERGKWHKDIDPDETDQYGGHCPVLDGVLKMTNAFMAYDRVYIQESFGCVFFRGGEHENDHTKD